MNPPSLSGKARRHLRALGHHLTPVVLVGKEGLSKALSEATLATLEQHELIKVKLGENAEGDRRVLADQLAASTKSHLVGVVGRTVLLYRARAEKPTIALPAETKASSQSVAKPRPAKPGAPRRGVAKSRAKI